MVWKGNCTTLQEGTEKKDYDKVKENNNVIQGKGWVREEDSDGMRVNPQLAVGSEISGKVLHTIISWKKTWKKLWTTKIPEKSWKQDYKILAKQEQIQSNNNVIRKLSIYYEINKLISTLSIYNDAFVALLCCWNNTELRIFL